MNSIVGGLVAGIAVHLLTAFGAVCGLLALHQAAHHDWPKAFLWLAAAALIDALDGPIARKVQVEQKLPRFSGERLDLVVDYLNYCAIPAFIVAESGIAGEVYGVMAGALILLTSLFHFADTESKTSDGYFVGFPAIWNVVVLYLFVFDSTAIVTVWIIVILALATFVPVKWAHPVRVRSWRPATLTITILWSVTALYEILARFPGTFGSKAIFLICAAYFTCLGLSRTLIRKDSKAGDS